MRVVYFGTPQFAANVLTYLIDHGVDVVAVVTKPDKAQGRSSELIPTPVKNVALERNIPLHQPEIVSAPECAPILAQYEADLFVVVAYGEIIKQHLLDMPKTACINLHGSLLPKFRGAAPIQRSIIEGETETGVTIIHMVKKMDAGDMIAKASIPIEENTTYGELEQQLCDLGSELMLKTIHDFAEGTVTQTAQIQALVTFAAKIEPEDCKIDWSKSAQATHNRIRGVTPHPGAWAAISIKGQLKRLRVLATKIISTKGLHRPGEIVAKTKEGLIVACGEGSILLTKVQLEGKKPMAAEEFARGYALDTLHFP